jgi:hypothetical protein
MLWGGELPAWLLSAELALILGGALVFGFTGSWLACRPILEVALGRSAEPGRLAFGSRGDRGGVSRVLGVIRGRAFRRATSSSNGPMPSSSCPMRYGRRAMMSSNDWTGGIRWASEISGQTIRMAGFEQQLPGRFATGY